MDDLIRVEDQFYILATATRAVDRTAVLQHDDTFAVFDFRGDIGALGPGEQGLYHEGMRHLSVFRTTLNGRRPLLLSARVKDDNELFGADLTNPDILIGDQRVVLMRDIVHLFRARFLWQSTWHERIRLCNYGRTVLPLTLAFEIDADFADIFEVRGATRTRRGSRLESQHDSRELRLRYQGLDGEERRTIVEWTGAPAAMAAAAGTPASLRFDYELAPGTQGLLSLAIRCERGRRTTPPVAFDAAQAELTADLDRERGNFAVVETSSERFNEWVRRSTADLRMLTSSTPYGDYPFAGVPWFATPFGRDGIITALQTLWINPRIAHDVLTYLAATQARTDQPEQDAEPGKILHEAREGEMASLGEVPFGRYYGSVDATPLFVMLAAAYFERTGDRALMERLLPHLDLSLDWIDRSADGDGFVDYARRAAGGLIHQGWKDSHDSVFHADGTLADPPIALCEVQAYVYAARLGAARLFDALGRDGGRAGALRRQAEQLRRSFEARFWCEAENTYALALDALRRPCRVRTSNAGHCLFGGIASPERARRVAEQLVGPQMFSGWGIRTVAVGEPRYNPMSYHNGSIWPHDNGIVAAGCSQYGFDDLVALPFTALFEASSHVDNRRLPELFCGFRRRPGEGPTLYPVACSPQAWAAGVVFQLIQACLRLSVDTAARRLTLTRPVLPPFLTYLQLRNIELPFGQVDLLFERQTNNVAVTVLQQRGEFEVLPVG